MSHTHCNEEVAQAVAYEILMFHFLYKRVVASDYLMRGKMIPGKIVFAGTGGPDEEEASSFLESLLLHTRVLYDFFCKPRPLRDPNPDDVYAGDFVPRWEPLKCADACPYLKSQKDRLNKSLAHLSIERVNYDNTGKGWEITTIDAEITALINKFKAELPPPQQAWLVFEPTM